MSINAKDLRLAGYSVSQCVQVGFDAASLRAGGYNDYELVNSGLFHPLQLRAIGCDIQRYALMSLFEHLDGKHWKNKSNWGTVAPLGKLKFAVKSVIMLNIVSVNVLQFYFDIVVWLYYLYWLILPPLLRRVVRRDDGRGNPVRGESGPPQQLPQR